SSATPATASQKRRLVAPLPRTTCPATSITVSLRHKLMQRREYISAEWKPSIGAARWAIGEG
ncbi:MAG TPA: hypothetical protein VKT52_08920, partial [Ktedonobacterales bacterium]|nr:hypothetical protein [Ktedonobacterales bacterium]